MDAEQPFDGGFVVAANWGVGYGQADRVDEEGVWARPVVTVLVQDPSGTQSVVAFDAHAGDLLSENIKVFSKVAVRRYDRPAWQRTVKMERKAFALAAAVIAGVAALSGALTWSTEGVSAGVANGLTSMFMIAMVLPAITLFQRWRRQRTVIKEILKTDHDYHLSQRR